MREGRKGEGERRKEGGERGGKGEEDRRKKEKKKVRIQMEGNRWEWEKKKKLQNIRHHRIRFRGVFYLRRSIRQVVR